MARSTSKPEYVTARSDTPTEYSTTLDSDVTKPSVTAAGDGPADTLDPNERAQSVPFNPGPDALKVGTVNTVVAYQPVQPNGLELVDNTPKGPDRIEEYDATAPGGDTVRVRHNIDTGHTEVIG